MNLALRQIRKIRVIGLKFLYNIFMPRNTRQIQAHVHCIYNGIKQNIFEYNKYHLFIKQKKIRRVLQVSIF